MKIEEFGKEAAAPKQTLPIINNTTAIKQPVEATNSNSTSDPDSSFFVISEKISYEDCKKELLRCIRAAKNKAAACREILTSAHIYFVLSDKTNQEIADAINPWVSQSGKKYVFTEDDFRKARRPKKQ